MTARHRPRAGGRRDPRDFRRTPARLADPYVAHALVVERRLGVDLIALVAMAGALALGEFSPAP
jgi:hypothetical protein